MLAIHPTAEGHAAMADVLEWLSDNLSGFIRSDQIEEAFSRYAELRPHTGLKDRFKLLFECAGKIAGFPKKGIRNFDSGLHSVIWTPI